MLPALKLALNPSQDPSGPFPSQPGPLPQSREAHGMALMCVSVGDIDDTSANGVLDPLGHREPAPTSMGQKSTHRSRVTAREGHAWTSPPHPPTAMADGASRNI